MQRLDGYMAGVNLGGWISQYGNKGHEHFKSFIGEDDIRLIASWGMDHIRVPVDYPVLEDDARPGVWLEEGFAYLRNSVDWAKAHGLNVVIDVHKAPGFSFSTLDTNTLFTDAAMQNRFIELWKEIARRYKDEGANVMYELLNEIVEPDSSRWNPLAQRLVDAIREVDREHYIIVGGNHYNSVNCLKEIPIFDDGKIVYNFHMYEPIVFTHQFASWSKDVNKFARRIPYPSDIGVYREFAALYPERSSKGLFDTLPTMDKGYIKAFLKPAADFMAAHDKPMYCGEYGVIDNVDVASRENWGEDVSDFLLEYGIGRAVWTYKRLSFTLIDADGKPVSERLIKIYAKR